MAHVRRDVWKLEPGWNDTLLWYARAVEALRKKPITDPASWLFLAAIHGITRPLWENAGYVTAQTPFPPPAQQKLYWNQCQHQNWYFFPWHRGYLGAFEQIVRATIVDLGGPPGWSLPYWNYNGSTQAQELPKCFAQQNWPDGAHNPLYVERRYGLNKTPIVIPAQYIRLKALRDHTFAGSETGVPPGFGGPESLFIQHGVANGLLESEPHNNVHGVVGGSSGKTSGLMSNPNTAALDPIFWLHHANIDRLWEVWLKAYGGNHNPPNPDWVDGPLDAGPPFIMPQAGGAAPWKYKVRDVLDTRVPKLDYTYEDTTAPQDKHPLLQRRLLNLGAIIAAPIPEVLMTRDTDVELIGANSSVLNLSGGSVDTSVHLDKPGSQKVLNSLRSIKNFSLAVPTLPDRVFLNLEHIRGNKDSALFEVYVNLAPEAVPDEHPELHVGTISLFGVEQASQADGHNAGNGVSQVLDITEVVDALHLGGIQDLSKLNVRFVPVTPVGPDDKITIGRVSLYRQGD
ncbi:tyrosinase family protein [Pseudomonas gingeri]